VATKKKVTEAQKFARKYLATKGNKTTKLLTGILVFDGLSEKKARMLARELVEASASLARGNAW
jgi:hypothetical protein